MSEKFESWAVVELFGHTWIAGRVTEASIGGCSFVRVDVPEFDGRPAFTRLLGQGAIYAINPCSEEITRARAARSVASPVVAYAPPPALPARVEPSLGFDDEDDGRDDDLTF